MQKPQTFCKELNMKSRQLMFKHSDSHVERVDRLIGNRLAPANRQSVGIAEEYADGDRFACSRGPLASGMEGASMIFS
jgi:hypothetical protein